MSLDLTISPFLSLAFSSSLLFPARPEERYVGFRACPVPSPRRVRAAATLTRVDPLPAARIHRDLGR